MSAGVPMPTGNRRANSRLLSLTDDLLQRAFGLAYFLHGDREIAIRIALEALSKLEIAAAAQDKRIYYRGDRASPVFKFNRFRRKVSLSSSNLLQRLVYIESEPYERQRAEPGVKPGLSWEDSVIYFTKYLVQITIRRNSFYVTLGVARLLHSYSTAATMDLYDAILGGDATPKGEDYYRSRKARLLAEIQTRFEGAFRIVRGPHGEERLEAQETSPRLARLVRESLARFTPWETSCSVRAGQAVALGRSSALREKEALQGHDIEVARMHSLLHPDCFERLTAQLGLDAPDRQLEIPVFSREPGQQRPPEDRQDPPALRPEERLLVRRKLAELAARRKSSARGLLRVLVDKRQRAVLDLAHERSVRIKVEDGDELIELVATDEAGGALLATCLLTGHGTGPSFVRLEGTGRFRFEARPTAGAGGEPSGSELEIAFEETSPLRAAAGLWRPSFGSTGQTTWVAPWRALPIAALVLSAAAIGLLLFLHLGRVRYAPPPPVPEAPHPATAAPTRPIPNASPPRREAGPAAATSGRDLTRQFALARPAVALANVRQITLQLSGDERFAARFSSLLASRLTSGPLAIARNREEADALLAGQIHSDPNGRVVLRLELRDADGRTIWPRGGRRSGSYAGTMEQVARRVAEDLENAIESARRQ